MQIINELNEINEVGGGSGQIIVCGMSCGGICLLAGGVAAAFATMTAALY